MELTRVLLNYESYVASETFQVTDLNKSYIHMSLEYEEELLYSDQIYLNYPYLFFLALFKLFQHHNLYHPAVQL